MQNRSKWLEQISPEHSVSVAAKITLKSRLKSVVHYLDLAANHADKTPEHVHQLRVYTRRSLAALRMYEEVLPKKEVKWFRKRLRRIRKAAGDARDLDVFLQRYEKANDDYQSSFLRRLKKRRRNAQRPIVALEKRLIGTARFNQHLRRLLKSLTGNELTVGQPLEQWARFKLAHTSEKFFSAIPLQVNDLQALHRFRVRGKQLRYTMELFSTLFPTDFRTAIYPLVTELQDRLGELNDHATACGHLETWCQDAGSQGEIDYLRRLIARECAQLEKSIEQFEEWWTPDLANRLESSLRAMTERTNPVMVRLREG